jgi:hypothetical protein
LVPRDFFGRLGYNPVPRNFVEASQKEKEMSIKFSKWTTVSAAALLLGTVTLAQDTSSSDTSGGSSQGTNATSTTPAKKPEVAKRKENQQDRIGNGVQSGQLTAGETANLEKKEAAINAETRADRAANGGKLTPQEKKQVNQQQNQVSRQIYKDKHNANTAHYGNNEVGQRRENQQDRIAQGVKSGQLTAGETAKLETQQKAINKQVKTDRAANGGKLTTSEKQQINKEQNATSKSIYNKKHNAKTQPQAKP